MSGVQTHDGTASHCGRLRERVGRHEPAWLTDFRDRSLARFEDLGFPLGSAEEWRFTPVGAIAETPFGPADVPNEDDIQAALARALYGSADFARLVFVNGMFRSDLSDVNDLPRSVEVGSLRNACQSYPDIVRANLGAVASGGPSFTSLNGALMDDGAFIHLPAGVLVDRPIHIAHVSLSGDSTIGVHPRSLVIVGEGSSAVIVESFHGAGDMPYLTNGVFEAVVGPNAGLEHYRLQMEAESAYHVGRTAVRLARDARYTSHSVAFGAAISRHDLGAVLGGENGVCTFNGLYMGDRRQLLDSHTVIDHATPHCESHELYKGILNGHAHGVFNGKVFVRKDAQKTDAKQTNQALLLSDTARIDSKPQLEIFADDVRCTHGATVGQLDADSLFYLRSRGISLEDARSVLIHAFASDIIDRMSLAEIRSQLEGVLLASLPKTSTAFWEMAE